LIKSYWQKQLCFLTFVLFALNANAQDTTYLKPVDIVVEKTGKFSAGKKSQDIDSSILSIYRFKSINDLLSENSGIFIKNYGPGALSSIAMRGGSAYHTALLWNGFNIQNPMLGQSDLTTLPVFLFDHTNIEYGGSSALWGSGAVSGSILLQNSNLLNAGTKSMLHLSTNSFGSANVALGAVFSEKKWALSTKIYANHSNNTYKFKSDSGKVLTQNQAPFLFAGLLQELKIKTGKNQFLSFNVWLNKNNRQIPETDYLKTTTRGRRNKYARH